MTKRDVPRLSQTLQLSQKIVCCQETVVNSKLLQEDFFILTVCLTWYHFLEETLHIFVILSYTLDYIYSRFNDLLSSWNQDILLALYCNVINQKGAPLINCAVFLDGTVLRIFRPKINQNIVYNGHRGGHKRVHVIMFQRLALSNRLIGNISDPYVGKRYYSTALHESGLFTNLQRSVWHNNQPFCIYGYWPYALSIHLLAPFSRRNLAPNPVSVEWLLNKIKTYAVGKIYFSCALIPYIWVFLVHSLRLPCFAFFIIMYNRKKIICLFNNSF